MRVALALALMLLMAGCLDFETYEVRILREKGDPAVMIAEFSVYSDAPTMAEAQKDFDELVKLWRGDEMLREIAENGIQGKNREVFLRDGKIIGRLTGIVSNLGAVENISVDGSQIVFKADTDWKVVETNGRILKTLDGEAAVWPKETTDMRVTFRQPPEKSSRNGQATLLKLLADYQAAKK